MTDVEKDQEEPVGEACITLPVQIAKLMTSSRAGMLNVLLNPQVTKCVVGCVVDYSYVRLLRLIDWWTTDVVSR